MLSSLTTMAMALTTATCSNVNSLDTNGVILSQSVVQVDLSRGGKFTLNANGDMVNNFSEVVYSPQYPLLTTDLFGEYYPQAVEYVQSMSLEEKVGQMFLIGCPSSDTQIESDVANYHVGGVILFAHNFEDKTKTSVKSAISGYQSQTSTPLIVSVDEEGGTVNRVSKYSQFRSTPFESPQSVYSSGGLDAIYTDTVEKANLLSSLGINLNLAPVADVSTNPLDYIYDRTFGEDATQTAEYISTSVKAYNSVGFSCTLKHFPGYGNNVNTHTGISIDERSKESFYTSDFLPFTAGIEEGVPFIMVNHNIVNCFDSTMPSSISSEVHRVLREDLGYTGIILTDDLYMDAIKDYTGTTDACVYAIQSGNDMLTTSDYSSGYYAVLDAIKSGTISEYRIDESCIRIIAYKYATGLIK